MPIAFGELVRQAKGEITVVSVEEAARRIREEREVLVLDVREGEEVARGALPRAVHIPRGFLEFKIEELCPDGERPILVHCASGGRAVLSTKTLRDMGYSRACAIGGGFAELQGALGDGPKAG